MHFSRWSLLALALLILAAPLSSWAGEREIRQFQGTRLSPFHRDYDNAVETPSERMVDPKAYCLEVVGLVKRPLHLTYEQVLALPHQKRLVRMPCVEGWGETLLYEGVRLKDLLARAGVEPGATTVIFHTAGGRYRSSLSLAYVEKADVLLGFRINGLTLDQKRGFPFQVVAPHKLGYKWVKWVSRIQVSDKPFAGYWERRGYSNQADTPR